MIPCGAIAAKAGLTKMRFDETVARPPRGRRLGARIVQPHAVDDSAVGGGAGGLREKAARCRCDRPSAGRRRSIAIGDWRILIVAERAQVREILGVEQFAVFNH